MENASKALIIAGSILVTILVISLGIMIFRNMSDTVENNANLTEQEISAFNNQILPYVGENVTGSQVNALIQTVRSINQAAINDDTSKTVSITFPGADGNGNVTLSVTGSGDSRTVTFSRSSQTVKTSGSYYKVGASYGSNGLIDKITVTESTT